MLQTATVDLTASQIHNLGAAPVEIVPAPGNGKVINVISVIAQLTFVTTPYEGGTDTMYLAYNGYNAGPELPESFFTASQDRFAIASWPRFDLPLSAVENKAVVLSGDDNISGTGDGTIRVIVCYTVEQLA